MDSTNEKCRCGHPKSLHRWAATGTACAGCITPDGGTRCWSFRAAETQAPTEPDDMVRWREMLRARRNAGTDRADAANERRFLAALSRVMQVAEPADLAIIVENANAAVLAEREACAVVAETEGGIITESEMYGRAIAAAIRARTERG